MKLDGIRWRAATVRCAGAWLLASLMLAAGGLRAETGAGGLRILMLGDSLTAGYGLAARDALPSRMEAALRERGLDGVERAASSPMANVEHYPIFLRLSYLVRDRRPGDMGVDQ